MPPKSLHPKSHGDAWGASQPASPVLCKSSRTTLNRGAISNGHSSTSMASHLPRSALGKQAKHPSSSFSLKGALPHNFPATAWRSSFNGPLCGCHLGFSQEPPSTPACSLKLAPVIKTKFQLVEGACLHMQHPNYLCATWGPSSHIASLLWKPTAPSFHNYPGPRETKGQFDPKMSAGSTQRKLTKLRGAHFLSQKVFCYFSACACWFWAFRLAHIWELMDM